MNNYFKSFERELEDGRQIKFTIRQREVDNQTLFFANLINVNLEDYQSKSKNEQDYELGVEMKGEVDATIYYHDPISLEKDIVTRYGKEVLKSKI